MTLDVITRFQEGRRIANDQVRDFRDPEHAQLSPYAHETRVEGIRKPSESLGYIAGIAENCLKHPRTMYQVFFRQD